MTAQYPSFEEIKAVDRQLMEMRQHYFYHHDLFSLHWWLLVVLLIAPWIIWWKLVDKTRAREILLFGSVLSTIIVLLDDIGGALGYWSYPYQILWLIPRLNSIDFSVLPVMHMLVYQYFRSWKSFVVANVIMALASSFLAEPLFVRLNLYDLDNWHYFYSFPLYIAKAMIVKWLLEYIANKSERMRLKPTS